MNEQTFEQELAHISITDFLGSFEPGSDEIDNLCIEFNDREELEICGTKLSTKKEEIKVGTMYHLEEGSCPFCGEEGGDGVECEIANTNKHIQKKLVDMIYEKMVFYTPDEEARGKIIDLDFKDPTIVNFCIRKDSYFRWRSKGIATISFDDHLYSLPMEAYFNSGYEFEEMNYYFKTDDWILYTDDPHLFLEIPHISEDAKDELIDELDEKMSPLFSKFEQMIKEKETSYPIPLIENVTVTHNSYGDHIFSFGIKGKKEHYTCTIQFDRFSDGSYYCDDGGISQNDERINFFPLTYKLHLLEQFFDIAKRFDSDRMRMIVADYEFNESFPFFEKADYDIDFSKVNYQYNYK